MKSDYQLCFMFIMIMCGLCEFVFCPSIKQEDMLSAADRGDNNSCGAVAGTFVIPSKHVSFRVMLAEQASQLPRPP